MIDTIYKTLKQKADEPDATVNEKLRNMGLKPVFLFETKLKVLVLSFLIAVLVAFVSCMVFPIVLEFSIKLTPKFPGMTLVSFVLYNLTNILKWTMAMSLFFRKVKREKI